MTIVELPVVSIKEAESLAVKENDGVTLTCSATGKPDPDQFEWTYPDGSTSNVPKQKIGLLCKI